MKLILRAPDNTQPSARVTPGKLRSRADDTDFLPDGTKKPPCSPGIHPLWPGGPCLPRWVELEAERLERMEAAGYVDEEPPSPAQERYLHVLGAGYIPISKDEASRLITQLLRAKKQGAA